MGIRQTEKKSGTATATYASGEGHLVAVNLCAAADAATVIVYDNTSAAGTIICKLGAGIGLSDSFTPCEPVHFGTGLHLVISGTTPHISAQWFGPKAS